MLDAGAIDTSIKATITNANQATKFIVDHREVFNLTQNYASQKEIIQAVLDAIEMCADTVMPTKNDGFKVDDDTFEINII